MKKRFIGFLLAVCMLLPVFCVSASAAKDYSPYIQQIEIKDGDTISGVCDRYGMEFYKVLKAIIIVNGLADGSSLNAVRAGQKLYIPKTEADAETIVKLRDAVVSAIIPASYVCKYTVKTGDTLYSICGALKLTLSACQDAIISLNGWSGGKDLTTIYEGQVLLLPVSDKAAKEISATVAKATDMNINVSANTKDEFEYYIVEYTLSSGESIKYAESTLGVDFTDDVAKQVMAINGINDLGKVIAGKKYLLLSASAENAKYAVYSHKVVSGDTAADLCALFGTEYGKVSDFLSALNTKASFPAIKKGQTILLVAPRGGEDGKTPIIIK